MENEFRDYDRKKEEVRRYHSSIFEVYTEGLRNDPSFDYGSVLEEFMNSSSCGEDIEIDYQ